MTRLVGENVLMRIFIGESDRHAHLPLYEAIVLFAKRQGLAGATVLRGLMGYGANSRIHTAKLLRLSEDLPIIIELVDTEENLNKICPFLDETVKEVFKNKIKTIGILATTTTIEQKLYQKALSEKNINFVLPNKTDQKMISATIAQLLKTGVNKKFKLFLQKVIIDLKNNGAQGIILGCSDLPLLISQSETEIKLFDTTEILANVSIDQF